MRCGVCEKVSHPEQAAELGCRPVMYHAITAIFGSAIAPRLRRQLNLGGGCRPPKPPGGASALNEPPVLTVVPGQQ